jgi:hypothetical protein
METTVIKKSSKILSNFHKSSVDDHTIYRGTNFRGVSRNGRSSWQILTMIDGHKVYLGTVDNIFKAALLYDLVTIQTKGLKAKVNFNYSKLELLALFLLPSIIGLKMDTSKRVHFAHGS